MNVIAKELFRYLILVLKLVTQCEENIPGVSTPRM